MKNFNDKDLPERVKQLPGVVIDSRKWGIVPSGIYLLEPKQFDLKPGTPGRCPMGVLELEIILPKEHQGTAISWYCNALYDKESGEIIFAYNSKLSKTARALFPEEAKLVDPPTGCLLENYLIGEIVLGDKEQRGGKSVDKAKERHYSKVKNILAAGPRLQHKPSRAPVTEHLDIFFKDYLDKQW